MSQSIKCPKCGDEMEKGYLNVTSGGLFEIGYVNKKPSFWALRHKGELLVEGWAQKATETYTCKVCQLIVFDYSMRSYESEIGY